MVNEKADVTEKMIDYIIAELRWKAKKFKKRTGIINVYNGDVVKSDRAISSSLKPLLQETVAHLEKDLSGDKDYHPGSNDQVWDLVHPSLWPLTYGRSRLVDVNHTLTVENCLESLQHAIRLSKRTEKKKNLMSEFSRNFQWLPCEVDLKDGKAR